MKRFQEFGTSVTMKNMIKLNTFLHLTHLIQISFSQMSFKRVKCLKVKFLTHDMKANEILSNYREMSFDATNTRALQTYTKRCL